MTLSLVADHNNTAAHSKDLVSEIITNREAYMASENGSRLVANVFPRVLRSGLSIIEQVIDKKIGHTGLNLIAVAAVAEGLALLVDSSHVQKLMKARSAYYALDGKRVNHNHWRECQKFIENWDDLALSDIYGGRRFDFYNVPMETATNVNTARQRLSMNQQGILGVCVAMCLEQQEHLSKETRADLKSMIATFEDRVESRLFWFEGMVELLKRSKRTTKSRKVKGSRRSKR